MNRYLVSLMMIVWVLWFTQEESRLKLNMPTYWSILGKFATESACNTYGRNLIDRVGRVPPQNGYTRTTAAMTMLDTHRGGQQRRIKHEVQTTLYCMPDEVDPRTTIKK